MVEIVLEKLFKVINVPIYKSGLSLGFQVAGYLLLVAGEVTSSHGDPPQEVFEVELLPFFKRHFCLKKRNLHQEYSYH